MEKIRIVSDSASDILSLDSVDFAYSPMKIITKEQQFVDDAQLDVGAMVDFLCRYKGKSKTSCPNAADWLAAFGGADNVICVTITSGLSGSYNSAYSAKQIYEQNGGKRVFVLDTLSAGPEITLIVRKIEEYISVGMSYTEVCEAAQRYSEGTGLVFMLKSLKNFANNGRISPIVAKLVEIAGICIVGRASYKGTLEPMQKCRGEMRSLNAIVEELSSHGFRTGKVSIGHCQNEKAAAKLREMLILRFGDIDIEIHPLRGLCSFYAEAGGLLVGYEKN